MDVIFNPNSDLYPALRSVGIAPWFWWGMIVTALALLLAIWLTGQYALSEYSRSSETPPAPAQQEAPARVVAPNETPPQIDLGDGDVATRTTEAINLGGVVARHTSIEARVGTTRARLSAFVMMEGATWVFAERNRYENANGVSVDIAQLFADQDFLNDVNRAHYIVGLGVTSGVGGENDRLSRNRAIELCSTLYQIDNLDRNRTRVYGLPLGYSTTSAERGSPQERLQRTVVVIGVERLSGNPDVAHLLRKVFERNLVDGIDLRTYSRSRSVEGSQLIEMCSARPLNR